MTYYDEASQQQAMLALEEEERAWREELTRDEAARREFHEWLASTYTEGNRHGTDRNEASEQFRDDAGRGASRPVLPGH